VSLPHAGLILEDELRKIAGFIVATILVSCSSLCALDRIPVVPFETSVWPTAPNRLDNVVVPLMAKEGLSLNLPCSDTVFVRRVYLDLLGATPLPEEVEAFVADARTDKRARLVDSLFNRDEYVEYTSLKLADLLRVKSEFPDNLWPNAVQAYYRWISEAVKSNMGYDNFARSLLLGAGSNFRQPASNFYRAMEARTPETIAKTVAQTWMAVGWNSLSPESRTGLAAFFARIGYKKTLEWKEEIVTINPAMGPANAQFPDGKKAVLAPEKDPRAVFADWLISPGNPWFSRAEANRVWFYLMGNGIIDSVDDLGLLSPAGRSPALDFLASEFVRSGWDTKALYRLILTSRVYQQSSIPASGITADSPLPWTRYAIRRLDAEVLIDALDRLGGAGENYYSAIPEPFTFIPASNRSISLSDGSITSSFLLRFGRPSRDLGLLSERSYAINEEQLRYLLNSTDMKKKIEQSPALKDSYNFPPEKKEAQIREIYRQILSRPPTAEETALVIRLAQAAKTPQRQAAVDLAWALVNSKEFLYKH